MEFARYLLKQGYVQKQITILVAYREQLLEFQKVNLFYFFKFKILIVIHYLMNLCKYVFKIIILFRYFKR